MTTTSPRASALADRHRALGSDLEDWNGMGTAWSYTTDPCDEHDAVREAAGVFDMSPLKKIRVTGPDATDVLDHLHSRDLRQLGDGQSAYGAVLTEAGTVADDAIAFRHAADEWLLVHGSGRSMELLADSAQERDVSFELDDDLHIVSVQGPSALALLDANADEDLGPVPYFHHVRTELFGRTTFVSRTGYSGERGYEIFASAADVGPIWDAILEAGTDAGVMPASFAALDKVRVEAGLLFYGYDMTEADHPSEVGLGWAISKNGVDYRGQHAALAAMGDERHRLAGITVDDQVPLAGGETLRVDGRDVGVVNSPAISHRMLASLALVHLAPSACAVGTRLDVVGDGVSSSATVVSIPFFDPDKTRTHDA